MYKCHVAEISVRAHPNADKLQIGIVCNEQVIVSTDIKDRQLGVYFPCDGQLSEAMCFNNNLFREGKGLNLDPKAVGYLDEKRRVRALTLRGARSDGIWLPLESLKWTGFDLTQLKPGMSFDSLAGKEICQKYMTPKTQRELKEKQPKAERVEIPMFKKHFDTDQLAHYVNSIPEGAPLVITSKLHGTSGRTANVLVPLRLEPWKIQANKFLALFRLPPMFEIKYKWQHVNGSRNITFYSTQRVMQESYYDDKNFRAEIGKKFILHKGETVYYEIVGYLGGTSIMTKHHLDEKDKIRKNLMTLYPKTITYSYGCEPGLYDVYVYRITNTNIDGVTTELSWEQLKFRCSGLGVKHVPEVWTGRFTTSAHLLDLCTKLSDGPDLLDPRHPKEGVCIKVEDSTRYGKTFKFKGFIFKYLEGIAKESDYVDIEESS